MDGAETYRPLLFGIAYRMLGTAMEAEDIVQEVLLRYSQLPADQAASIRSPKAYLGKMVTHLCLDHLKSAQVQRELYIGPWLPEPIPTPEGAAGVELESLSMAFLVLLEKLNPAERAVFLLHEVFDYSYTEIAGILGKDEANCRQLFHRAKARITASRPRFTAVPEAQQTLLQQFMQAAGEGDLSGLVRLLADDVTVWSDGGGKASAATRPIIGRESVMQFLIGLWRKAPDNARIATGSVNGCPAIVVRQEDEVTVVFVLEIATGVIQTIRAVRNPDKLRYITQH